MSNDKKVIAIVGMPGSGKSVLSELAEKMGFPVIVMGDIVREETAKRGLEPTPENVGKIMLMIREEEGPAVVAKRCLPKILKSISETVVVEGVRSLEEVEEYKKKLPNLKLVAIHSSPETRFHRLHNRKRSDDPKSWAVFSERDKRELSVGTGSVIAMADYMIINECPLNDFESEARKLFIEATKDARN